VISVRDILLAMSRPLGSSLVAAGLAFGVRFFYGPMLSPLPRLLLEGTVLLAAYTGVLLFAGGRKSVYLELLRGLKAPSSAGEKSLASA
jgi:hypothetical protein